ncbi:MAG: hypothetical protein IJS01_13200, partial [Lentisphaeria bacterium]|nr:hypothetical protein [Lentisphaeria bacterium]
AAVALSTVTHFLRFSHFFYSRLLLFFYHSNSSLSPHTSYLIPHTSYLSSFSLFGEKGLKCRKKAVFYWNGGFPPEKFYRSTMREMK